VGYTLDEIKNDITKKTPASFEPTIDYVVTKTPVYLKVSRLRPGVDYADEVGSDGDWADV